MKALRPRPSSRDGGGGHRRCHRQPTGPSSPWDSNRSSGWYAHRLTPIALQQRFARLIGGSTSALPAHPPQPARPTHLRRGRSPGRRRGRLPQGRLDARGPRTQRWSCIPGEELETLGWGMLETPEALGVSTPDGGTTGRVGCGHRTGRGAGPLLEREPRRLGPRRPPTGRVRSPRRALRPTGPRRQQPGHGAVEHRDAGRRSRDGAAGPRRHRRRPGRALHGRDGRHGTGHLPPRASWPSGPAPSSSSPRRPPTWERGRPSLERFAAGFIASPAVSLALRSPGGHRFVRGVFGTDPVREHLELTRTLLAACAPLVRASFLAAIGTVNLLEGIATIGIPTTVVVGSRDRLTAPARSASDGAGHSRCPPGHLARARPHAPARGRRRGDRGDRALRQGSNAVTG